MPYPAERRCGNHISGQEKMKLRWLGRTEQMRRQQGKQASSLRLLQGYLLAVTLMAVILMAVTCLPHGILKEYPLL